MSALTPQGLEIDRLNQIIAKMQNGARKAFGDDINTEPDSVFTQFFGILAEIVVSLNEGLLGVYNAFYPDSAEGMSLDNVCSLVGVRRLAATVTRVVAIVTGNPDTEIPAGAKASVIDTLQKFTAQDAVTLTLYNPIKIRVAVAVVVENTLYMVDINGTHFEYASLNNATAQTIAAGLVELINTIIWSLSARLIKGMAHLMWKPEILSLRLW